MPSSWSTKSKGTRAPSPASRNRGVKRVPTTYGGTALSNVLPPPLAPPPEPSTLPLPLSKVLPPPASSLAGAVDVAASKGSEGEANGSQRRGTSSYHALALSQNPCLTQKAPELTQKSQSIPRSLAAHG